jgi:uncharacterized protein (TIGR02453 family)
MGFRGWPAEALSFFEGLEADNSKTYWQAHKEIYDVQVRAPMDELLAELADEFGEGKVFRPYRDVRFSADKSPYKTQLGAMIGGRGYVQLSTTGLAAGCGAYQMATDQLERYRRAVADDKTGTALVDVVARARAAGLDVTSRESLKTMPKGYPADHPRGDLLRNKGLITWQEWPVGAWLGTRKAKDRVVGFLRASAPLADWLDRNVGEPTADPRRR